MTPPLTTRRSLIIGLGLACSATLSNADIHHFGVGLTGQNYSEPAMQLTGPGLGLRYEYKPVSPLGWSLGVEVDFSKLHYKSDDTGNMSGKNTIDTRWLLLREMGLATAPGLKAGMSIRTNWNDLRGLTSTQNRGYVRENMGVWASLQWRPTSSATPASAPVRWHLDLLLVGQQKSYLSQANSSFSDVTNRQARGLSIGGQMRWQMDSHFVEPYFHYTWIGRSNTVAMGTAAVTEPRHERLQMGIIYWH
jgi:hypothetical protein